MGSGSGGPSRVVFDQQSRRGTTSGPDRTSPIATPVNRTSACIIPDGGEIVKRLVGSFSRPPGGNDPARSWPNVQLLPIGTIWTHLLVCRFSIFCRLCRHLPRRVVSQSPGSQN